MLPFFVLTAASIFLREQRRGADSGKTAGEVGILKVGSVLDPDKETVERIVEAKHKCCYVFPNNT